MKGSTVSHATRPGILLALAAACALAACASGQPEPGAPDRAAAQSGKCQADAVQWAVGQPATQDVMHRIWHESGSGLIRPIAPGQTMTKDYRDDRINVELDAGNAITRIRCG